MNDVQPLIEWWEPLFLFEDGNLGRENTLLWFAQLIASGNIWKLPSPYLGDAIKLLESGTLVTIPNDDKTLDS